MYPSWEYLLYTIAVITGIWTCVIWLFLIPDPELIGISIEEYTEKEALILVATEKDVYDRIITNQNHIEPE